MTAMDRERWQRLDKLFAQVVALEPTARETFLRGPDVDDDLRRELAALLAAEEAASKRGFLEAPALQVVGPATALGSADRGPAPQPTMATGAVLAGRFRVGSFLARGGMGEVYAADDLELGERVALKIIRPDIAHDETAMARLRREVQAARQVSHPSVCRYHDIHRHQPRADDGTRPLIFVAMALYAGRDLEEVLEETGPMSPERLLDIIEPVADALQCAHERGIVHRDLKPSNIMVEVDAAGATQVVITDFGLAAVLEEHERESSSGGLERLTASGAIAGTPAYMAPEQLSGESLGPATDIYALGALMYRALTGRLPFHGDNPRATAYMRLSRDPTPPGQHCEALPARWDAAIMRCLRRDPAERFADCHALVRALRGAPADAGRADARRGRPQRWRIAAGVGLLAAVFAVAGYGLNRAPTSAPDLARPGQARPTRPTVAVVSMYNLSGQKDVEWLSTALLEMLTMELSHTREVRVLSGASVAQMRRDLELSHAPDIPWERLEQVCAYLGCEQVLVGSYFAAGADQTRSPGHALRVDVRLEDISARRTLASFTAAGQHDETLTIVAQLGEQLRASLGAERTSPEGSAMPNDLRAARLYTEGLERLRRFDASGAIETLARAVEIEPRSALIHMALSRAWSDLGHDPRAAEAARAARELGSGLVRAERLLVEARYRESVHEWGRAVDAYRTLFEFYPDELDYGLALASAQILASRGREALETLQTLRATASRGAVDPRIDLVTARAEASLSDHERAYELASRAELQAQTLGAEHLVASAQLQRGKALVALGRLAEAAALAERARAGFAALGDRRGESSAVRLLGAVAFWRGARARALSYFERSLAIDRELQNAAGIMSGYNNIGVILTDRRDHVGARESFAQALAMARELDDKPSIIQMGSNLGEQLADAGQYGQALEQLDEVLAVAQTLDDPAASTRVLRKRGIVHLLSGDVRAALADTRAAVAAGAAAGADERAWSLVFQSHVLRDAGQLQHARQALERALALHDDSDSPLHAKIQYYLSLVVLEQGDIDGAERHLERATASGMALLLPQARARVAWARGQLERAQELAREATLSTRSDISAFVESDARLLWARVLIDLGRPDEAEDVLAGLPEFPGVPRALRANIARAVLRADGARGRQRADIRARLNEIRARAEELELLAIALEAEWCAAALDARWRHERADERLQALAVRANVQGYLLLSRRARALMQSSGAR